MSSARPVEVLMLGVASLAVPAELFLVFIVNYKLPPYPLPELFKLVKAGLVFLFQF